MPVVHHQEIQHAAIPADQHPVTPGVQIIPASHPEDQHQEETNHQGKRIETQGMEPTGLFLVF